MRLAIRCCVRLGFRYFFANALPDGVAGLIVAALFATTMSVFSGGINGIVTCFIVDVLQVTGRGAGGYDSGARAREGGGGGGERERERE